MIDILIIAVLITIIVLISIAHSRLELTVKHKQQEILIPVKVADSHNILDQVNKIDEELEESIEVIHSALLSEQNGDCCIRDILHKQLIAEELVDVQVACETALAILGFNQEQRDQVRQQVNRKNRLRGYH